MVADRLTYLDHAATTPMRAEAVEAMLPYLSTQFANPSGSHRFSRDARRVVDEARDRVAAVLGCAPGEVVFTSGGTEADNTAVLGVVRRQAALGGPTLAVCPAVEHHAVLHAVESVEHRVVGVDRTGRVDLDALAATLDHDVAVVSVMAVNNEVGTITSLAEVASVVRTHAPQAVLHTDAVQAASWLDLRSVSAHVDALSLSAHKFGGPKGVGVLMVRDGLAFEPLLVGGGQERDRRSGTHNVAGIVAMTVALEAADAERDAAAARLTALRDRLVDGITGALDDVVETVPRTHKVAGSAHVCIAGIENEALLFLLDEAGVCASAASACASGAMEPSHVLAAMGVPRQLAMGALRLTLGHASADADVDRGIEVVVDAVGRLRRRSSAGAQVSV
jgi:cysteine desulfurase